MFASRGYSVFRVPARFVSGTHYTYTNVMICNELVLIPSYSNSVISPHNAEALDAWQSAMPGARVEQIGCQSLVTAAGVMHCIVMHIPPPLGGPIPTAFLRYPRGGEVFSPGEVTQIRWHKHASQWITGSEDRTIRIWVNVK